MTETSSGRVLLAIPSINGGDLLARMLPTLRGAERSVVVLDQASTDDTAAVCAQHGVELVQLGRPHTYTEACNIGARLARERGADYVCVANNDIVFKTDVVSRLVAEMDADPSLGIAAPSQIIIDDKLDKQPLSYRVFWKLRNVEFFHDTVATPDPAQRLDADFCELTCAVIRQSVIEEIGFLDDTYGFYHEDADFGFRLQKAGYSCAYFPQIQIEHYSSSTFSREKSERKAAYIARNKLHFATKHLGLGLRHDLAAAAHEDPFAATRGAYLERYGLIEEERPELSIGQPSRSGSGWLLTTFAGDTLPEHWAAHRKRYDVILTASQWVQALFNEAGFDTVRAIPPGVDTDIFQPWGPMPVKDEEAIYLMVAGADQNVALADTLEAWHRFDAAGRRARLVVVGHGLLRNAWRNPDSSWFEGAFHVARFDAERIEFREIISHVEPHELASLYRWADFTIFAAAGVPGVAPILESLACGTPCLFAAYGPAAELIHDGALSFGSGFPEQAAIRGNKPDIDGLLKALNRSSDLDETSYLALQRSGLNLVRARHTVRHSVMAIYRICEEFQKRDPARVLKSLQRRSSQSVQAISWGTEGLSAPASVRQRLGPMIARRVMTLGRLTEDFGRNWQDSGLSHAARSIGDELRQFAAHRSQQFGDASQNSMRSLRRSLARRLPPPQRKAKLVDDAALLIGYIDADLGLGESSRGMARAMADADVRFAIYPFTVGVESRRSQPFMQDRYDEANNYPVNIIEVATNELATVFDHLPAGRLSGRYNILRTYWELSKAPAAWRPLLSRVDELWVPNAFVEESFRHVFEGPITVVPPCIDIKPTDLDGRVRFDLDPKRFYFMFSFDYFSFPQRKNPLGLVRAFRKAFPDPATPVGLIVKSTGAVGHYPEIKQALRDASRQDGRIEIIDETLDRREMLALIQAADCYTSLHRAEGFGLGMAEAMALGKPVIATAYSGNAEFVTPETAYAIPYKLRDVPPDGYVYPEGQVWAEPDEAASAAAMAQVFGDQAEARERAHAGQAFIARRFGPANVGNIAATRLAEIFASLKI